MAESMYGTPSRQEQLAELERENLNRAMQGGQAGARLSTSSLDNVADTGRQMMAQDQRRTDDILDRESKSNYYQALTASQRNNLSQLSGTQAMVADLKNNLGQLQGQGGDLGGLKGAGSWLLGESGLSPLTEAYDRNMYSGAEQMVRSKAAAISGQIMQDTMKGVLSDQDAVRLQALDLSNPNLTIEQLMTRLGAAEEILATKSGGITGVAPSGGGLPAPSSPPAAERFIEVDGQLYIKE